MSVITHLYLDDIRTPPEGWTLVKNYAECIAALEANEVYYLSLDHDLAEEHYMASSGYFDAPDTSRERTGYDVVKWIVETGCWPTKAITLHTANPAGRIAMRQMIERFKPDGLHLFG